MLVSASLLAADFSQLSNELERVKNADMLHLDVMDGCFVPNISFGVPVISSIRKSSSLFFDTHMMISHPLKYVEPLKKAGADLLTFHVESEDDPEEVLRAIEKSGARCGMAISPDTPPEALYPFKGRLFLVTVMTVYPGFGGQKLIPEALSKIAPLKEHLPGTLIEVDGGVNRDTLPLCGRAGADVLVAGTAVFGADDAQSAIESMKTR